MEDVSGVSGVGVVAEGVQFSDGRVAMRWICGEHHTQEDADTIDDIITIHGHGGRTAVEWLNDDWINCAGCGDLTSPIDLKCVCTYCMKGEN